MEPTVDRSRRAAVPSSSYRLQLHGDFGFDAAAAIAPYLSALGVSHVYCSPYLQSIKGSRHGYDVVSVVVRTGGIVWTMRHHFPS